MNSLINENDIRDAFLACGVNQGDSLMLHSDAIFLAQLKSMTKTEKFEMFFDLMKSILGDNGTLIIPTFSYSPMNNEVFDNNKTQSRVGSISEFFRGLPDVKRSYDPIFSVSVRGKLVKEFMSAKIEDSFGKNSVFSLLEKNDCKIACLGCSMDRITFTHYVEQSFGVKYRYFKNFDAEIIDYDKSLKRKTRIRYYVRDLKRDSSFNSKRLVEELQRKKMITSSQIGRIKLISVKAKEYADTAKDLLRLDPNVLINEGAINDKK